jgi:hypothetical protein
VAVLRLKHHLEMHQLKRHSELRQLQVVANFLMVLNLLHSFV